jgi:hypothetical protein
MTHSSSTTLRKRTDQHHHEQYDSEKDVAACDELLVRDREAG